MQSLTISTEGDKEIIPQNREMKVRFKSVKNGKVRVFVDGEETECKKRLTDCVEVIIPFDAEKKYRVEVTYTLQTRLEKWLERAQKVLTEAQGMNVNKVNSYFALQQVSTEEEYVQMIDGLPVEMLTKLRLKEIL